MKQRYKYNLEVDNTQPSRIITLLLNKYHLYAVVLYFIDKGGEILEGGRDPRRLNPIMHCALVTNALIQYDIIDIYGII